MERTALCFVVGPGWIRNCEKPGISLPSPPYCPTMCEPSCEEADHQSLDTGGDRGTVPQNPNDREAKFYTLFQYLINVAGELECPPVCKVELSVRSLHGTPISARACGWSGLQAWSGAGGRYPPSALALRQSSRSFTPQHRAATTLSAAAQPQPDPA